MYTILVHVANQDPVKLDVDELPSMADTAIIGRNPRERSDQEVKWIEDGVTTIAIPWWRINYIQILPSPDEDYEFPLPFRE
jgi:hypothetical protein